MYNAVVEDTETLTLRLSNPVRAVFERGTATGSIRDRFEVFVSEPGVTCLPVDRLTCSNSVLCFKHGRKVTKDNTVRYTGSTLQLLPSTDRPTLQG